MSPYSIAAERCQLLVYSHHYVVFHESRRREVIICGISLVRLTDKIDLINPLPLPVASMNTAESNEDIYRIFFCRCGLKFHDTITDLEFILGSRLGNGN